MKLQDTSSSKIKLPFYYQTWFFAIQFLILPLLSFITTPVPLILMYYRYRYTQYVKRMRAVGKVPTLNPLDRRIYRN